MEDEKVTKPPRVPRKRRKPAATGALPYNPGQFILLMDLLREFSGHIEVASESSGKELTISLKSDMPHLDTFIAYKIRDLVSQQKRLAKAWKLNQAG